MKELTKVENAVDSFVGSKPTAQQLGALTLFLTGKTKVDVAKEMGISRGAIQIWARKGWWKKEVERHLEDTQADYHKGLRDLGEDILGGVRDVAQSREDKTAAARVNLAKLASEVGKNPLIDKKGTNINIGTTTNIAEQKVLNINRLGELTESELTKILLGESSIPDRVKIINPEEEE